ncbi:hypothetical protein ABW20_dc0103796 [Dactylellina cionopaga]|nr:hypothetical protein ABW20_dc0103796 [Dactylellina cionopaga]
MAAALFMPAQPLALQNLSYLATLSSRPAMASITKLSLGWFEMSSRRLSQFKSAFMNLRSLTLLVGDQHLQGSRYNTTITEYREWNLAFCDWLEAIGSRLEQLDFTVCPTGVGFENVVEPFLCPVTVGLPKLKEIRLHGVPLALENLVDFLDLCKGSLKEIWVNKSSLESPVPSVEWHRLLRYLKREYSDLLSFRLAPMFPYGGKETIYKSPRTYLLPCIEARRGWVSQGQFSKVSLMVFGEVDYKSSKDIGRELGVHDEANRFWDAMTDGRWVNEKMLRALNPA